MSRPLAALMVWLAVFAMGAGPGRTESREKGSAGGAGTERVVPAEEKELVSLWLLSVSLAAIVLVLTTGWTLRTNAVLRGMREKLELELAERRRAEDALRASEAFYHTLVETLPQNILRKDCEGRFTFANVKFLQSLGKSLDEVVGKTDYDFYPRALADAYRADDAVVMETARAVEKTEEHTAADGEKTWVHIIKTPLQDPSGALIGTQCIYWDVTAEKRSEQAVRKSRERYEVAVQGSKDGLWDWDLETHEVFFSPQWKSMLGYADDELGSGLAEWETRVHPDDLERARKTVEDYLAGRSTDYVLEHRLRHKDGSYRWILARGAALRDAHGRPYRFAGSHTDITSRKNTERTLREQNERLERAAVTEREALDALKLAQSRMVQSEKLASLGQMVAGVAHEINNPLSFVGNNIAVLQRDLMDLRDLVRLYEDAEDLIAEHRPDLHAKIAGLKSEADITYSVENLQGLLLRSREGLKRIQQIVKDLRLFARIDEGDRNEADLNAGIESTITIIHGHAHKKGVKVMSELGPLPAVTCYPARINQVVMNLVSNAIDATPSGGSVTVRTRSDRDAVVIEVADTGTGIPQEIREKIFDPFFTTKPIGQGTGLGLSISYGIVHDHGGTIEVESAPGRGTTFTVRLPIRTPLRPKGPSDVSQAAEPTQVHVMETPS